MTREVRVSAEGELPAPPDAVWEWIADHERMREWMPVAEVVRRRPGAPDPDGLGALRVVHCAPLVTEERVVAWKPPERLEWLVLEGAPLREARGEAVLAPRGERRTQLRLSLRFRPLVPGTGWWLRRVFARQLRRGIEGLEHKVRLGRDDRCKIWPRRQRRLW